MSYAFIVYGQRDRLPSEAELEELDGVEVLVMDVTPRSRAAYREELEASGEQDDGFMAILDGSDTRVTLSVAGGGSAAAARQMALDLATRSGGWFIDPQTGERIRGGGTP